MSLSVQAVEMSLFQTNIFWILFYPDLDLHQMLPLQIRKVTFVIQSPEVEFSKNIPVRVLEEVKSNIERNATNPVNASSLKGPCGHQLINSEYPNNTVSSSVNCLNGQLEVNINLVHVLQNSLGEGGEERIEVEWSSSDGLRFLRNGTNTHLLVTTIHSPPYVFVDKDDLGKLVFSGYLVEIIETLSKKLDFRYTLKNITDASFGLYHPETRTWDGIIGELSHGTSDIGLGSFNPTKQRATVVDFLTPNIEYGGLSILTLRNKRNVDNVSSYVSTFNWKVWLCLMVTMVITGILTFLTNRVYLHKHHNEAEEEYNKSPLDSVLFIYGALLQQGADGTPNEMPSRIIFITWWILCVIFYACYTAVLTSSFTVKEYPVRINSVEELLDIPDYIFGTRRGTYHMGYIEVS
ncbi:glutamate receptor 1-like [Tachypleus tridentatus]|uniref:glutamate receptor 1-like n=1 Tax=Tachypleus tridentatus TaxID=6853 RepID=UPI003FCFD428